MASTASGISRTSCLCSQATVLTQRCNCVLQKMHWVSLGKDDSKCKTQALQKINMTAEALYASWWVSLFQNYLHFRKTFPYKFSQSLQLLFLNSHRPLKIHRHLVIDLFGSRADLQIDHPVTKPTEVSKVKEEVSSGLAQPSLAAQLSVITASPHN